MGRARPGRRSRPPPGGLSPSITPASIRRRRTSATSRCDCWPRSSRRARSTSSSAATSTTISARFPCTSHPRKASDGKPVRDAEQGPGPLDARQGLSTARRNTRPQGVIYLVTGAGGNQLYNPEQQDDPGSWQPFTLEFISTVHSLTVADVEGRALTVRQVSAEGASSTDSS